MDYKEILYDVRDGIATITLNNPEVLNAISPTQQVEWVDAIARAKDDDAVRVVVVTGAGRAFCAGRNLRLAVTPQAPGQETEPLRPRSGHAVAEAVLTLDKPYIGAINGPAAGGGMDQASLCDIRLAAETARFIMAYIRLGGISAQGGLWKLPRIVGTARALELMWTGRTMDAEEALRFGYVSAVFPQEGFMERVYEFCQPLVEGPQQAIREIKKLTYRLQGVQSPLDALRISDDASRWVSLHRDPQEGARAFLEGRRPNFEQGGPPKPQ